MISTQFSHIAVTCTDPIKFEEFYNKYFHFKRARTIALGNSKELVFIKDENGFYFEIFPKELENPLPPFEQDGPHFPGIRHIAFKVDDIDAKLIEMGKDAIISLGPLSFDDFIKGWKTVWLKDPEGNILEISQGYTDENN